MDLKAIFLDLKAIFFGFKSQFWLQTLIFFTSKANFWQQIQTFYFDSQFLASGAIFSLGSQFLASTLTSKDNFWFRKRQFRRRKAVLASTTIFFHSESQFTDLEANFLIWQPISAVRGDFLATNTRFGLGREVLLKKGPISRQLDENPQSFHTSGASPPWFLMPHTKPWPKMLAYRRTG